MATGPGVVAEAARARGARTVGVDFSRSMAALARSVTDVVVGDVDALPFAAGSFDVALCNFGLLHFGNPERALGEIARVLAPRGRAALTVWAGPETNIFFGAVYRAIEKHAPRRPDVPPAPAFFHFADEARFRGLLAGAGLRDVTVERVAWKAHVASARSMVALFLEGSVRTAAILRAQDAATLERITASIEAEIAPTGGDVPVAALVARGRKG
jgi:SAM-dependent methyltransferase